MIRIRARTALRRFFISSPPFYHIALFGPGFLFLAAQQRQDEQNKQEQQQRADQQRPQQDLAQKLRSLFAFDVFQAYPSCSVLFNFSVRFRITVRITMVTAEIIPMAEASPKAN